MELKKYILENIIDLKKKNNKPLIIGIDGPTAAGKTILSKKLKIELQKSFKNIWICQLDWTLKSRIYRSNSLENFKKKDRNFYYESQDHMDLEQVIKNLKKIKDHNYNKKNFINIKLNNLYNRLTASNNNTVISKINQRSLIIVEGHYTSILELDKLIDYNILLLAKKKVLLKRKIDRVKHYRNSFDTKQYFKLIDIPSFINHLSIYGTNYDLIVDNTNYKKPKIKNYNFINQWSKHVFKNETKIKYNIDEYIETNFYPKFSKQFELRYFLNVFLKEFKNFDQFVSKNIKINIQEIKIDLSSFLSETLNSINKKIKKKNLILELKFTNNFHKIYYKTAPFFVGLNLNKIKNKFTKDINIITKIENKEFVVDMYWNGGVETFKFNRDLGKIFNNYQFNLDKKNLSKNFHRNKNKKTLKTFIPTDFMYFDFLSNFYHVEKIFINREETTISAANILENFFEYETFWVHRFSKFKERDFFKNLLDSIGAKTKVIGNYIISYKIYDRKLANKLDVFLNNWSVNKSDHKIFNKSKNSYDLKIDRDRQTFLQFVNSKTKLFKAFDNSLFLTKGSFFNVPLNKLRKDLKVLLSSKNRNVRKNITLLIEKNFANLSLPIKSLWNDKIVTEKKKISLSSFVNISPTILSDMYLWLSIKKQNSSILACNVYDIRPNSFDQKAFLEASQSLNTPVIIQSSFNAIGQKTKYKNSALEGYLKLKNGGKDFLTSTYKSARDVYLKNEKNFLFGIGLDHIDYKNDLPKGRAIQFIKSLQKYNLVTHYTLDGSHILEKFNKKNFSFYKKKLFEKVIDFETDLIKYINNNDIFDYEFCASELSYVGNNRRIFIPTVNDMIFFSKKLNEILNKKSLSLINIRPRLIIGNLGTTHHGHDQNYKIKVENSEKWIENTKRYGMISAVLHGTSRSHPETLRKAVIGCKKINVAGDFLQSLVSNLPDRLRSVVSSTNDNEKKKLYLIREKLNDLPLKNQLEVKNALKFKCLDIMKNINTPILSDLDINYFKYKLYNYNNDQINTIIKALIFEINSFKKININKKKIKTSFLPSPIEVEYGNFYKKIIKSSIVNGFKRFHIDVGDGNFINRVLNVENKIQYIKSLDKSNLVHVHLMTLNPHQGQDSYIKRYARLGSDRIGIHRKSISHKSQINLALDQITENGSQPGIFIEVDEVIDDEILSLILKKNINWVVLMGVPVGFGGQFFNEQILFKAITLRKFAIKKKINLKIEVDGGLDRDNILMCKNFGVDYLSGWSLVKSPNIKEYEKNINTIRKKLK